MKVSESSNVLKEMVDKHSKLEDVIESLKENHAVLYDGGKKGGQAIP